MLDVERHKDLLRQCSIAAALEAVGERWSFLILRGAFNGLHHFEEFQSTLGIARNILSNRLGRLVENDILERTPDPSDRRKISYKLTDKGLDLWPILVAVLEWGDRYLADPEGSPLTTVHRGCEAKKPTNLARLTRLLNCAAPDESAP